MEEEVKDLNEVNHAVQRFANVELFEQCRTSYCAGIVISEDKVEDAITGNELRIEDQLIFVAPQNIGEQIKRSDEAWGKIKDVKELVELLLKPSIHRSRGVHLAQPTLVRAGPGTGKTWMVKQAAYTLAKRLSHRECEVCRGKPTSTQCEHFGMQLVPILVYVQRASARLDPPRPMGCNLSRLALPAAFLPWSLCSLD